MPSLGAMLARVHGLVGKNDLSDWETGFIESVWKRSLEGKRTDLLSERQVDVLERIFHQHFAG